MLLRPLCRFRAERKASLGAPIRRLGSEQGYTLIELLTTLLIMGIVIGALTTVFVSGSNAQVDQQSRFQAQETARVALDQLRQDAHYACRLAVNSVTAPIGASITFWFTDQTNRGPYDPVGTCVHTAPNASYDIKATWCTSGSTTRWGLYRNTGTSCGAAAGVKWADFLTSGAVFSYVAASSNLLGRLHVDFPVNTTPTKPTRGYRLSDDIALLNTVRQ